MRLPLLAALAASLALSACGFRDSRLNPFNWFDGSTEAPSTLEPEEGYAVALGDNRTVVDQVTELKIEPAPGGAILSARGLPPTQGWWDVELLADNNGDPVDGVLTFRFLIAEPRDLTDVSTPQSREVTVATFLSTFDLDGVRRIVVTGERNSRSVSR